MKTSNKPNKHEEHKHSEHKSAEHKPKEEKFKPDTMKSVPGKTYSLISGIIIVVLLALIVFLILRNPSDTDNGTGNGGPVISDEDKVKVEFYVMSQCPYGTQVEDAFAPVLQKMGDVIDFHLDYIVSPGADGGFQSLHGEPEVKGNIVQLCAIKYYPEDYKYMDFIICQNKDYRNIATNWEKCASDNDMDVEKLRTCLEGDEGKQLLTESMQKAQARQASGSPTMFFDDAPYGGQRDQLSFQRAICQFVEHSECASIPACGSDADCIEQSDKIGVCNKPGEADAFCTYEDPVEVEYIILNAADCTGPACDTERMIAVFQNLFLGAKPRLVDVDSEEGKQLIEDYSVEKVPVYIFDASLTDAKTWGERPDLQSAFDKVGDNYRVKDEAIGATHYVDEEARKAAEEAERAAKQEAFDALGIVFDDNRPQIDFFVMSYCPYGNQAEEGIAPVFELLGDKADFNPKYVIYSNYGGGGPTYCIDEDDKLCSMHGIVELNQNIREACVAKHMGIDKWFEFALEMNEKATYKDADEKWEAVAKDLGLDVDVINTCFEDEGEALMAADKELGDKLGVRGSPSVFVDGSDYEGGRTPEAYKQALCAAFEEPPAECDTMLEGDVEAPAQGSC